MNSIMKEFYSRKYKKVVKRNYALDVIRTLAITLVLVIHTFSFDASRGASNLQASILCFSKMAVPLFVLLTGYLNHGKTVEDYYSKGKWRGCFRVLVAYVVLGTLCYLGSLVLGHEGNVLDYIKRLLAFKLTPYGWYVEMWIGLFFLTPFLNAILSFSNRKTKQILIKTLLVISSIPLFVNRNGNIIIPSFWMSVWPITLYCIGAYISEEPLKIKGKWLLTILLCIALGEPLLNWALHTSAYLYFWGGQDSVVYLVSATCMFVLILRKFPKKQPNKYLSGGGKMYLKAFFKYVSD